MANITRKNALSLAIAAYEATPEAEPEVVEVLNRISASLAPRKSTAPSKEFVKSGNLIAHVLIPYAEKVGKPFTAKEFAEGNGTPDVTTVQKASGLITRAIAEGKLVVAPWVKSRTTTGKNGKAHTSLVKPCYQIVGFDFEPFAPKAKEEAEEE